MEFTWLYRQSSMIQTYSKHEHDIASDGGTMENSAIGTCKIVCVHSAGAHWPWPRVARSTRPREDLCVSCGLVDIAMKRRYLAMICHEYVINMKYYEFIRSQ